MLPFKLVYSDDYYLPIGSHVFPAEKSKRIHDRLLAAGMAEPSDFVTPRPASDEDVLLVHSPQYVEKLKTGTLSAREQMELEVPFSTALVKAFWLAAGGSILAADHALGKAMAPRRFSPAHGRPANCCRPCPPRRCPLLRLTCTAAMPETSSPSRFTRKITTRRGNLPL